MAENLITKLTKENYKKKLPFFILFSVLVISISLAGLNGSLQNVDEVLYARVSRESLEHQSWLIQYKDGQEWFHKAPMIFWAVMSSFKLFGISDFTARLPAAFAGIVSAFMILFISRKIFNSTKTGVIAAFIYLTSLQVNASTHQVATDSLLVMFLLISLFFLLKGVSDKASWLLPASFFNGMVFLTKLPLGFVVPATLFIYILFEKKWRLFPYLVTLLIISLGISLPYFIYIYKKIPQLFVESFIYVNLIQRFHSGGDVGIGKLLFRLPYGIAYYAVVLLFLVMPFTPAIFFVFYRKGETGSIKDVIWNDLSKILSIYFLVVLFGYSLLEGHWLHWSMPMIPVVVIFLGNVLDRIKNRKLSLAFSILAFIVLAIFIFLYLKEGSKYPAFRDVAIGLITVYAIYIIINLVIYFRRIVSDAGIFLLVTIFFIIFTVHTAVTVPLDFNKDIKSFSDVLYDEPSPLIVIATDKVNEGSKTTATIWYLKMPSIQYNSFDVFKRDIKQIEKGTYLIYYREYTEKLYKLFSSFKELKTGRVWNLGVVE